MALRATNGRPYGVGCGAVWEMAQGFAAGAAPRSKILTLQKFLYEAVTKMVQGFAAGAAQKSKIPPTRVLGEAVLAFLVLWRTVFSKKLRFFLPKLLTISLLGCIIGSSLVNSVNLSRKKSLNRSPTARRKGAQGNAQKSERPVPRSHKARYAADRPTRRTRNAPCGGRHNSRVKAT